MQNASASSDWAGRCRKDERLTEVVNHHGSAFPGHLAKIMVSKGFDNHVN
jgi:hypothetical protein